MRVAPPRCELCYMAIGAQLLLSFVSASRSRATAAYQDTLRLARSEGPATQADPLHLACAAARSTSTLFLSEHRARDSCFDGGPCPHAGCANGRGAPADPSLCAASRLSCTGACAPPGARARVCAPFSRDVVAGAPRCPRAAGSAPRGPPALAPRPTPRIAVGVPIFSVRERRQRVDRGGRGRRRCAVVRLELDEVAALERQVADLPALTARAARRLRVARAVRLERLQGFRLLRHRPRAPPSGRARRAAPCGQRAGRARCVARGLRAPFFSRSPSPDH